MADVFQLTTSRRGRHSYAEAMAFAKAFQLTTSRRGRQHPVSICGKQGSCFNSRPHEEVDYQAPKLLLSINVSTHDLTKRSTECRMHPSTHHLMFQLTTSRRGRRGTLFYPVFSQLFQLTTSRRGRPMQHSQSSGTAMFQLTTSRRGRQFFLFLISREHMGFNSRPHEEVDNPVPLP